MTEPTPVHSDRRFARRLGRARLTTTVAMMVERFWPLVLPLVIVASLFVSLSWLGLFRILPDTARLALIAALGLAGLASLYPLRFYRQPTSSEIDRRIESANEMLHTPVLVQSDRPVGKTGVFADALWREHQRRMAEKLGRIGSDLPRTRVPERDPWGIRAGAALLLVTAFAFSLGPLGGRLSDAFEARAGFQFVAPRVDAWVTPPSYTGKAPIFLTADANRQTATFTVPQGSEVSLRVTGGAGDEALSFTDADGQVRDLAPGTAGMPAKSNTTSVGTARQFSGKLDTDGVLSLKSGARELQSWAFAIIPDKPPTIRFTAEPTRAANGALELSYEITDDYGPASAKADFKLAEDQEPGARPLYGAPEMPLSVPRRGAANGATKMSRDLTEHAWAGSLVNLTLKVTDGAGQEASSETKTFLLPERPFTNPLAKAVVEHRRILSLDANLKPYVLQLIDAITLRPEDTIKNPGQFLGLMAGRSQLQMAGSDDALRSVADYFWEMALAIEDGALSAAEKRLRQAQEALKQALENNASDEEIDKLMKELREAMADFLREFAERAAKDPNLAQQMPQQGQQLSQRDLERMMDQIENLAKSGNRDQARELLSQLQDMMNNLQARRNQQPGQNGDQSEMRQQMDKLGEIMRRQQEMMNETFRTDRMQRGENPEQGQQGQQGDQNQQGRPMTPEEFAEALKELQQGQGKLREDLEGLTEGLEGLGIKPGEGFGEAGEAMGEAEGALGEGNGERAVGEQGRALEALRRGAQDMMQQMQQAMQGEEGTGEQGSRQQNFERDPLGRPRATTGPDFGDSVKVPDEIDVQRARRILDAIRKRLGNALSPELERNYLERLLEMR
ncbi:TIGR02302 family protein [Pseudaminobacter sp. NGMCC 1.201702]|uniref:TIGR02302 family protein n=1 Tax=Pseudaminobacter sp. NGMCC 1.201702 TaxID=3391825 RepID=UPI0039F0126C